DVEILGGPRHDSDKIERGPANDDRFKPESMLCQVSIKSSEQFTRIHSIIIYDTTTLRKAGGRLHRSKDCFPSIFQLRLFRRKLSAARSIAFGQLTAPCQG